ncbi:MAG: M48 family metalloprotease [Methylococcales bacterium]|nr:M48 family metalloprotease [Methylococcales bacterium]
MKRQLIYCLIGLLAFPPVIDANNPLNLPDMGDSSGTLLTPVQEQELGEAFFRSVHRQLPIAQDAEIQHYIETIGTALVAQSEQPGAPFHFFVVLDGSINAFAGPGGYIGVNSGLILKAEAESELAAVMAHEIAHVTQRHLYRAFEAASKLALPSAAAMLAAILLGTQSPEAGQAALIALQAGSTQFQIDFTRSNEEEADRVGMQILAASNYDPRSMPIFFERLQQAGRYYGQQIPEFLRTHPVTTSRISDSRARADHYPYRHYPDSVNFLLAQAKLRVMTADSIKTVQAYFNNRLSLGTDLQKAVTRYGLALALLEAQDFSRAETLLQALTEHYPFAQFANAYASSALKQQRFDTALQRLQTSLRQHPGHLALTLSYIEALLAAGKPDVARQQLLAVDADRLNKSHYYQLLARIYGDLKQPAESHRYMAEYYYASGQTQAAIMQIRLAQKAPDIDFYLASILSERLTAFLKQLRAEREQG